MKTKVFGTFGPSCKEEVVLSEMIEAGLTGMRLNLSHTTLSKSEEYIRAYQSAAKKQGVIPQILIDMKGPELRIGDLGEEKILSENEVIYFGETGIPVPEEVLDAMQAEDEILLDDGKLLVKILKEDHIATNVKSKQAQVLRGGKIQSHKSIKITGKNVSMPALTPHDIENIKQAKEYGVTALMQPFVLSGEDLKYVRKVLEDNNAEDIKIFAKIENRLGVEHIEEILPEADVIIIARGDLGNDMPLWELPAVQKELEEACKKTGKPYVVVTQMLASMEKNPVPTRAEISDIYHAVYHGAWGVMLTGETAIGAYPVEAISYLANTSKEAEKNSRF